MNKIFKVGILGGTGIVGQKLIQLLINDQKFVIEEIGASEQSVGKFYKDVCIWKLSDNYLPEYIQNKIVKACFPNNFTNCDLIFSTLPLEYSYEIEKAFLFANFPIISNSSCYRMNPEVPLIIPYINNDHLELIKKQQLKYNLSKGFLITNANCVTTGVIYAIYNLHQKFKIKQMNIVTMQSISGAGSSGINAFDICNNVIPYIDNEEDKLKNEPLKILGNINVLNDDISIIPEDIQIDVTCNRVSVINGHMKCISLKFHQSLDDIDIDIIKQIILDNNNCIRIFDEECRPQPRIDSDYMKGFGISIGRLRKSNYWDLEMTVLSNNLVLGSAGSSILNAEICINNNLI